MYLDKLIEFSSSQEINATAISDKIYDRGNANADIVGGSPKMKLIVQTKEAFNTLTSLTITLESSAVEALTSSRVHATRTILLAALTINQRFTIGIPSGQRSLRYLGVRYTVNGTNPTTGIVSAWLVRDDDEPEA